MVSTPLGEKFLLLDDYVPNIGNDTLIYDEVFPAIRPKNDSKGNSISLFYFGLIVPLLSLHVDCAPIDLSMIGKFSASLACWFYVDIVFEITLKNIILN